MKWFLIAVLIALPLHADDDLIDADRPGIADGSHSVKQGHFQIEFGANISRDQNALPTLLRYGVSDSFELRAENNNGSAPFSLGFKDHFFDDQTVSAGVIGRWFIEHQSFGDVRLVSDVQPNDHWDINPNVGFAIDQQRSKSAIGALTVQYNFTKKTNIFVDTGVQRSDVTIDGGAAWILGNNTQLDASVLREVHGGSRTTWSAGVSHRF